MNEDNYAYDECPDCGQRGNCKCGAGLTRGGFETEQKFVERYVSRYAAPGRILNDYDAGVYF